MSNDKSITPERKLGLSCAECRRSKLRCDRNIPCQACIRRGCASICPDGILQATKGNKVILNQNQKLQEQIRDQTNRIHELEAALKVKHIQGTSQATTQGNASVKEPSESGRNSDFESDPKELAETTEAMGSLSIGDYGQARFHGQTAGSEYLRSLLPPDDSPSFPHTNPNMLGLPWHILELFNAFPFGNSLQIEVTKDQFVYFLPAHEKAMVLTDLYYENSAWMYNAVTREDFMEHIMKPLYITQPGEPDWDLIHPHQLSVFFTIQATGAFYEGNESSAYITARFHALACAALALNPIAQEATCATIQALFIMTYFLYQTDRLSGERRWLLTGLTARLAQSIGLQRDSVKWDLGPEETQRRRIMFWELYMWDSWTSVVMGRPPALNIRNTDCPFPNDIDPTITATGEIEFSFHAWKIRYMATCLTQCTQYVFSTKVPEYSTLLVLDRKIRKFPIPLSLQAPTYRTTGGSWSLNPSRAMMQHCVLCTRESSLLYIHRSYVAQAVKMDPENPLSNKFGASLIAAFRSACLLISGLRSLYAVHSQLSAKVWFFWSGVFSSCIVLGALVVESPACPLSGNALLELDQAISLYEQGSKLCRPPGTLDILTKLQQRAHRAYALFHAGQSNPTMNRSTSENDCPNKTDALRVLGGSAVVIKSSKHSSNTSSPNTSSPAAHTDSPESAADRLSPPQKTPSPYLFNALTDVSPALIDSMMLDATDQSDPLSMFGFPSPGTEDYQMLMQSVLSAGTSTPYGGQSAPSADLSRSAMPSFGQASNSSFSIEDAQLPQLGQPYESSTPLRHGQQTAMDFTAPNQEEIWQNFINDLGISSR